MIRKSLEILSKATLYTVYCYYCRLFAALFADGFSAVLVVGAAAALKSIWIRRWVD